jgi:hypothetical protein
VAVTAGRRVARLLLMIGLAVAAYAVLSLLDHAARAGEGLTDRLGTAGPIASVEKVAADATKDARRSTSRAVERTAAPVKAQARRIEALKIEARKTEVRQVVRSVIKKRPVTTRVTTAIRTEARRVSTAPVTVRKTPVAAARTAQATVAEVSSDSRAAPTLPRSSAESRRSDPGPSAVPAPAVESSAHPSSPAPAQSLTPPTAPDPDPASPPPHRDGQGAGTTHLRDCGGGTAPPVGTVPSSWWPELAATVVPSPAEASNPGRTVRYCGPPS